MNAFAYLPLAHLLATFRVFIFMLALLPLRATESRETRWGLASAIVLATADEHEQNVLVTIARHESLFDRAVADCVVMGAAGDRTAWQVVPLSLADERALCVSYEQDARVALDRVRQSIRACWGNPPAERLAAYARGRCDSTEGRRLSRIRWPSP